MFSFQEKVTRHTRKQKQSLKRENIRTGLRYSKDVGMIGLGI